jgi:transmembrane sensor
MDKNELQLLAQKYLDGTANSDEKQILDQWYGTIHSGWSETVDLDKQETEEDVKQRILDNLNKKLFTEMPMKVEKSSGYSIKRMVVWVGSVAAVLVIAFFAWFNQNHNTAVKSPVADKQLVSAPSNRVIHLTLSDGTKVWLNAGSVFKYPKNFTGKNRMVELVEGRAFFDVVHQTDHPFVVKTKNLNITVLGTSFDVRSYKNEGTTRVSVVTGKVGITMPDKADNTVIMLLPRQQVVLSSATSQLVKEPTPEININSWCKNNFVFEQESLGNVFKALEKEYNKKITVSDSKLLDEKISIKLNNQHLDTIMEILSFTKHFKYEMANDSTVMIK